MPLSSSPLHYLGWKLIQSNWKVGHLNKASIEIWFLPSFSAFCVIITAAVLKIKYWKTTLAWIDPGKSSHYSVHLTGLVYTCILPLKVIPWINAFECTCKPCKLSWNNIRIYHERKTFKMQVECDDTNTLLWRGTWWGLCKDYSLA